VTHFEKRVLNQWAAGGIVYLVDCGDPSVDSIPMRSLPAGRLPEFGNRITPADLIIHEFPVNAAETRLIRSLGSVVAHTDVEAVELGAADLHAQDVHLLAELYEKNSPISVPGNVEEESVEPVSGDQPALFLDRDGVIIKDVNYPDKAEDVQLMVKILPLLTYYQKRGWPLIVITNQSGIGRGYYGTTEFHSVNRAMEQKLAAHGITIDAIFYSPYYSKTENLDFFQFPQRRKPAPGLFFDARDHLGIDLSNSVMVGNRSTDLLAGYWAGISDLKLFNPLRDEELMQLNQAKVVLGFRFEQLDDEMADRYESK